MLFRSGALSDIIGTPRNETDTVTFRWLQARFDQNTGELIEASTLRFIMYGVSEVGDNHVLCRDVIVEMVPADPIETFPTDPQLDENGQWNVIIADDDVTGTGRYREQYQTLRGISLLQEFFDEIQYTNYDRCEDCPHIDIAIRAAVGSVNKTEVWVKGVQLIPDTATSGLLFVVLDRTSLRTISTYSIPYTQFNNTQVGYDAAAWLGQWGTDNIVILVSNKPVSYSVSNIPEPLQNALTIMGIDLSAQGTSNSTRAYIAVTSPGMNVPALETFNSSIATLCVNVVHGTCKDVTTQYTVTNAASNVDFVANGIICNKTNDFVYCSESGRVFFAPFKTKSGVLPAFITKMEEFLDREDINGNLFDREPLWNAFRASSYETAFYDETSTVQTIAQRFNKVTTASIISILDSFKIKTTMVDSEGNLVKNDEGEPVLLNKIYPRKPMYTYIVNTLREQDAELEPISGFVYPIARYNGYYGPTFKTIYHSLTRNGAVDSVVGSVRPMYRYRNRISKTILDEFIDLYEKLYEQSVYAPGFYALTNSDYTQTFHDRELMPICHRGLVSTQYRIGDATNSSFSVKTQYSDTINLLAVTQFDLLPTVVPQRVASKIEKYSTEKLKEIVHLNVDNDDLTATHRYDELYYIYKAFYDGVIDPNWRVESVTSDEGKELKFKMQDKYTILIEPSKTQSVVIRYVVHVM